MPDVTFNGPAGRLEGKYFQSKIPGAPIALVTHPHPQHNGTMNNKVTYRIYESFVRNGFSTLRFNFRGVGHSEGVFDNGIGEMSDAAAALDWLHAQNPQASRIWISGFSFGAYVILQLLMRRPDVKNFIAVSPPANHYDMSFLTPCPSNGLFLVGENDDITPPDDIEQLMKTTIRQKGVKLCLSKIPGADHFYSSHQDLLSKVLNKYITANIEHGNGLKLSA